MKLHLHFRAVILLKKMDVYTQSQALTVTSVPPSGGPINYKTVKVKNVLQSVFSIFTSSGRKIFLLYRYCHYS